MQRSMLCEDYCNHENILNTHSFGTLWVCYHVLVFLQNNHQNKITITPAPKRPHFSSMRLANFPVFYSNPCLWGCEGNRYFICCWWGCKLVKPVRRAFWNHPLKIYKAYTLESSNSSTRWLFTVGLFIIKQTNHLSNNNNEKANQSLLRWVAHWSGTSIPLLTHSSQMLGWGCAATHRVRWSGGQQQKSGTQVARSSHISGERKPRGGHQGLYHHAEAEGAVGRKVRGVVWARSRWASWTMVFALRRQHQEGSEQRKNVVWL